jgi:hypothetical protein
MPILGSIIKAALEIRSKIPLDLYEKVDPVKAQKRVLKKLLRKAQFTIFGEDHNFDTILKQRNVVKAFKENVSSNDYNSIFSKYWYRTLNGESFVCWPGKVNYFALSSGTSEASSKYIPVTGDVLHAIKKTSVRQIFTLPKYDLPREFFERGILMLGGSTHLQYNGTYYEGDLSGITAGNIPFWFQHFYKPGKRISRERNWPTKLDEIVKNAKNWDISVIVGVPAWLQILMEKIIEEYNLNTIHDIWPNLEMYVHGGVSFEPYKKGFEKLLDHPLIYMETYLASEGFLAYQTRPETNAMQLVLDNGIFFEFVPFNSNNFTDEGNIVEKPQTLTIGEVEEGVEYALLISTCAGCWRYLIGDTIKFTSKERSEILITGRTKFFLNICGEHMSQENMNRAVKMLSDELNVDIKEFTVAGIRYGSMFAHKWYLGTDSNLDPELVAHKLDEYLKVLNDDYRVERIEAIRDVFAEVYPSHVFYDYMKHCGKEGGQNKFPRVLRNEKYNDWVCYLESLKAKL